MPQAPASTHPDTQGLPQAGCPRTAVARAARWAGAALLAAGCALTAQAQSLAELYDSAKAYDATYLAAQAQRQAAGYRVEQTYALNRPTVGLQGSWGKTSSTSDQSSKSESTTGSSTTSTSTSSSTDIDSTERKIAVSLQQSLYNRQNDISIQQAELSLQAADIALKSAEQDLIIRVSQAYFDVLTSRENLNSVMALKSAISEQLASAKRNFEVGTATITDTREAQSRYDLVVAQEIAARNDLLVKERLLDQLTGVKNAQPWSLAPNAELPSTGGDEAHWLAQASEYNLSLAAKRLELESAKLETTKSAAGHLPTVALTASIARNQPSGSTVSSSLGTAYNSPSCLTGCPSTSTSTSTPGSNSSQFIGVVMNVPLFAGFATQNRVREAAALEDKTRNELEAVQRNTAQTARTAYFGVVSGLGQVKAYEAAEASSQSLLEASKLGYQVGVRVNLDVLNAQSQLFDTKAKLAKARYDLLVGGLRLRQAGGVLKGEDVQGVSELLVR